MRLRKKLTKIKLEVLEKQCSISWSLIWGNVLYNKTVMYVNPYFESLFKGKMEEKNKR